GGTLLALGGAAGGGPSRVGALSLVAASTALVFVSPSEVQSTPFLNALADLTNPLGVGTYYATSELTPPYVLNNTNVARWLKDAKGRLAERDRNIAILLILETLKRLGAMNISGDGLRQTLDLYLPGPSKTLVTPFLDKVTGIKSDGHDHFEVQIRRDPGV